MQVFVFLKRQKREILLEGSVSSSVLICCKSLWIGNNVLIISSPNFTVGWPSGYHGCWGCWWNFRKHFPNTSLSWTLKIRVSNTTTLQTLDVIEVEHLNLLLGTVQMGFLFFPRQCGRASWWSHWYNSQTAIQRLVTLVSYSTLFCQSSCLCFVLLLRCFSNYRGMKRRDFSLRRYWRREDDGTYG